MNFGVILAGGVGSRMGADCPKQFLDIGGRPILYHTVSRFVKSPDIDCIYVGVHADFVAYTEEILAGLTGKKITVMAGGKDRNDTLFRVLGRIADEHGGREGHIVVTHDAVRPFINNQIIADNIKAAREHGACGTAIPCNDTIVVTEDGKTISRVPDRSKLWAVQTPQTFDLALLFSLYETLTEDEVASLTDACKICVLKGYPVQIVKGSPANLKLTTPEDLVTAEAQLKRGL